ncbi:MAG: hypothetical protein IPO99_10175 [Nitrospira sp.]|nr:hypothetical protein [Nitrospira sp.]
MPGILAVPILIAIGLFTTVVDSEPTVRTAGEGAWWQAAWAIAQVPSVYWLCMIYGVTFGRFVRLTEFSPVLHDRYGSDPIIDGFMPALCGFTEV